MPEKMNGDSSVSRVHSLIENLLRDYVLERSIVTLTNEDEKTLLIALSRVLGQIQLWTSELDCSSDNEVENESLDGGGDLGGHDLHSEEMPYLCEIVTSLTQLLMVENQNLQHLTGNVLLAISKFMSASGSNCCLFIHLLFVCAELSVKNILSPPSILEDDDSSCTSSESYILAIKSRLRNANWSSMAGISRVVRCLWKYLKHENDDQLVEVFLDSLNNFLSNVPFVLMDEIYIDKNAKDGKSGVKSLFLGTRLGAELVFLGYFVPFLCSVAGEVAPLQVQHGSFSNHPAVLSIIDLVPRLLCWCLGKQEKQANMCIRTYFRHKLLMLMIRLSSQTQLRCPIFSSWLQLLHDYFNEFLSTPITKLEPAQDDTLEGSPFASCIFDGEVQVLHAHHIMRQATFLFLRCSLGLIHLEGETGSRCDCSTTKLYLNLDVECCHRNKGFVELYLWIRNNLPTDTFSTRKLYWGNCLSFASSFLHLFMHEDDLLIKVLLQMLRLPIQRAQELDENMSIPDVEEDFLFHVSHLFNPVRLFNIFLAEMHYDHQVLLDYLISKETGMTCAEYLLKCLRIIITDSSEALTDFSILKNSPTKRRRAVSQDSNLLAELPVSVNNSNKICLSIQNYCKGDQEYGYNHERINGLSFEEAKRCLFSLKDSVENLTRNNLFPYNPKVLLKRLVLDVLFSYRPMDLVKWVEQRFNCPISSCSLTEFQDLC